MQTGQTVSQCQPVTRVCRGCCVDTRMIALAFLLHVQTASFVALPPSCSLRARPHPPVALGQMSRSCRAYGLFGRKTNSSASTLYEFDQRIIRAVNAVAGNGETNTTSRLLEEVQGMELRSKLKILLLDASRLYGENSFGEAAVIGRAALDAHIELAQATSEKIDSTGNLTKVEESSKQLVIQLSRLLAIVTGIAGMVAGVEAGEVLVWAGLAAGAGDEDMQPLELNPSELPLDQLWSALRTVCRQYAIKKAVFAPIVWYKFEAPIRKLELSPRERREYARECARARRGR